MNKTRKLLALVLSLVMVFAIAIPASADYDYAANANIVYSSFEGKTVKLNTHTVIYAYNKPRGYVCTSKDADKDSIFNYVEFPCKVNYVGRLDKDSEGLLLLSNDGELCNEISKARNQHEKEYVVRVDKEITADFFLFL